MRRFALLILLFSLGQIAYGQPTNLFNEANSKYQQEEFAAAAELFDSIVNLGYAHPETFYNLGNTHFRMGNLGKAILNYERALKANPQDEDAKHNLELANRQVVDEFNVVPTPPLGRLLRDITSIASSTFWTIIAIGLFVLTLLFGLVYLFKSRSTFVSVLFITLFALGILVEGIAYAGWQYEQEEFAIIIAANTYVKSAPANTASDLFILHEGTKVKVLETFEGWDKVRMPDGKIGWIQKDTLNQI